jgi:hypothetical protein
MFFHKCEYRGKVTNRYGVKNEETTNHTGLFICTEPVWSWDETWRQMQWYQ